MIARIITSLNLNLAKVEAVRDYFCRIRLLDDPVHLLYSPDGTTRSALSKIDLEITHSEARSLHEACEQFLVRNLFNTDVVLEADQEVVAKVLSRKAVFDFVYSILNDVTRWEIPYWNEAKLDVIRHIPTGYELFLSTYHDPLNFLFPACYSDFRARIRFSLGQRRKIHKKIKPIMTLLERKSISGTEV